MDCTRSIRSAVDEDNEHYENNWQKDLSKSIHVVYQPYVCTGRPSTALSISVMRMSVFEKSDRMKLGMGGCVYAEALYQVIYRVGRWG